MMRADAYLAALKNCIETLGQEDGSINCAAGILAKATMQDRLIHLFATEPHTAMLEGELFFRNGGLANINPIYDPAFDFSHGAYRCALCQSLDGLVSSVLDYYENIESGDPIILLSNHPHSVLFTEAVSWAKAKGLVLIVIAPFEKDMPFEAATLADAVINTHAFANGTQGDCPQIETAAMATVLNLIINETLQELQLSPVWRGATTVDIVENQDLIERYIYRVKHL